MDIKPTVLPRTMNIPESIVVAAEKAGLDCICTGGGMDYIIKNIEKKVGGWGFQEIILCACNDAGSPNSINDPASLSIFDNEDWCGGICINFTTAQAAIDAMATATRFPTK